MNIKKRLAFVFALSALMLASCSNDEALVEGTVDGGQKIRMTVTAQREGAGADSRTSLEDKNTGKLDCVWTEGDRLIVTNAEGKIKGHLDLISGAGEGFASFSGDLYGVKDGEAVFNYYYLGTKNNATALEEVPNPYTVDYSNQAGTLESLSEYDVMTATAKVNVNKGNAPVENILLERRISFARFQVNLPEDATVKHPCQVTLSGEQLANSLSLNMQTREVTTTKGNVTVTTSAEGDFYMTYLPTASPYTLTFTATDGTNTYEGEYTVKSVIGENVYFRKKLESAGNVDYVGIPVTMNPAEAPNNPGDTGSWGVNENLMPEHTKLYPRPQFELINDGWTTNTSLWTQGGFGTYIRYDHNGITKSGLLFSDDSGYAYYYQWGRWFGFPPTAYNAHVNSGGSWRRIAGELTSIPGVDRYNDGNITGYIWDDYGWGFFYQSCYFSNLSKIKADRFALVYACVSDMSNTMDYMSGNVNYTWEERSGNPCPNGYRLPTPDELAVFIPEKVSKISGSYAEVKIVNGEKFAMKWVVNTGTNPKRLEIRSVRTDRNTVSADDAIFENAPVIYFHAFGYMDWDGKLQGKGTVGAYWSNASGALSDRNANGGTYLEIDFNGSVATLGLGTTYRSMGLCVLPIKDDGAETASITPWFPIPN